MAVKYDLMVANGSYTKEGQEKTSWLKIGRAIERQNGKLAGKLDCVPTSMLDRDGNSVAWNGWFEMFEPRAKTDAPAAPAPTGSASKPTLPDDIPF